MNSPSKFRRFHTLDALRGLAALLVAFYHFQRLTGQTSAIAGYLAVDLFFVLSGFVIALNYEPRLAGGLSARRFIEMRLVRLYPLYWAGLMLAAVLAVARVLTHHVNQLPPGPLAIAFLTNLIMVPSPFAGPLFPLNGPSWSLFFEMLVNIAFAAGLWRWGSRALSILVALAALWLIWAIRAPAFMDVGWEWAHPAGGLVRAVYSFGMGMLICRLGWYRAGATSWLALVVLGLTMVAIMLAAPQAARAPAELLIVLGLFPALVAMASVLEMPAPLARISDVLGDASYPVYALHWSLITLMLPIVRRITQNLTMQGLLFVSMALLVGWATARWFDGPVRRRLGQWRAAR